VDSSKLLEKTVPPNVATFAEISKIGGNTSLSKNIANVSSITIKDGIASETKMFTGETVGDYTLSFVSSFEDSELGYYKVDGTSYGMSAKIGFNEYHFSGTITDISLFAFSVKFNGTISKIQLEEGTVATSFQEPYVGYKSAKITKFESFDKQGNSLGSYDVTNEILSLHGYGEGNPNALQEYNLVDFSSGTYHKKGYIDQNGNWITDQKQEPLYDVSAENLFIPVESGGKIVIYNEYYIECPTTIKYQKVYSDE
jgi:hypothetical protein